MFILEGWLFWLQVFIIWAIVTRIVTKLNMRFSRNNTCLVGKTVIVTGGNSGLGYETAITLAGRGGKVIIADINDTRESVRKIKEATQNENVVGKYLDLGSLDSVRAFAKEIHEEEERLDILVNNAGTLGVPYSYTKDGIQTLMHINYFGHFLLTHLLTDLLKKGAPSRIVFVSSVAAFMTNLNNLERVNNPLRLPYIDLITIWIIYCNSKLCTLIASNMFAEKLNKFGITSNAVHPGCVSTPLMDNSKGFYSTSTYIVKLVCVVLLEIAGKTPLEGAQSQINCALSDTLKDTTGKLFLNCKPFYQPSRTTDKEFCRKLWELSEKLVKLKENEKLQ